MPDARTVGIYVWEKVKDYLGKAGSTIFIATIVIWLLLNFGPSGFTQDMSDSFGAWVGKCPSASTSGAAMTARLPSPSS